MAVWHIVVLYFAIFALLQLVVYRYLRGRNDRGPASLGSRTNPESGRPEDHRTEPAAARDRSGDGFEGARFCPQCGTRNEAEQVYSYCRNCADPLGR